MWKCWIHVLLCCLPLMANGQSAECSTKQETLSLLDSAEESISEAKKQVTNCGGGSQLPHPRPIDCIEVLENGNKESGIYTVFPRSRHFCNRSIEVYCDMETEGGGYIITGRKIDPPSPEEYAQWIKEAVQSDDFYGSLSGDFYIGNDNLHSLSNQAPSNFRVELELFTGERFVVVYEGYFLDDNGPGYSAKWDNIRTIVGDREAYSKLGPTTLKTNIQRLKRTCL